MIAFEQLTYGLLIAHAALAYFFLCGTLVTGTPVASPGTEASGSASDLCRIVLISTAGMAITGIVTFVFGVLHVIYPVTFAVWTLAVAALFVWRADSPFEGRFWRARVLLWRRALSVPACIVYAIALVIAIPAYIPDTGSDATAYHLPYAWDWASAHA